MYGWIVVNKGTFVYCWWMVWMYASYYIIQNYDTNNCQLVGGTT